MTRRRGVARAYGGAAEASIKQNIYPDVLPDFRNLGVIARILVAVNLLALGAVLYAAGGWAQALDRFVQSTAFLEPLLLASLVVLYAFSPQLARLPYLPACALVLLAVLLLTAGTQLLWVRDAEPPVPGMARALLLAAVVVGLLIGYFRLLAKAFSPALSEARLQALQARIRPHFLFNSLNAVLALIRRDPKRAERALEDLADLFRTPCRTGISRSNLRPAPRSR